MLVLSYMVIYEHNYISVYYHILQYIVIYHHMENLPSTHLKTIHQGMQSMSVPPEDDWKVHLEGPPCGWKATLFFVRDSPIVLGHTIYIKQQRYITGVDSCELQYLDICWSLVNETWQQLQLVYGQLWACYELVTFFLDQWWTGQAEISWWVTLW